VCTQSEQDSRDNSGVTGESDGFDLAGKETVALEVHVSQLQVFLHGWQLLQVGVLFV
jgi:hypothetical protein